MLQRAGKCGPKPFELHNIVAQLSDTVAALDGKGLKITKETLNILQYLHLEGRPNARCLGPQLKVSPKRAQSLPFGMAGS